MNDNTPAHGSEIASSSVEQIKKSSSKPVQEETHSSMSAARPIPLLICSIGNPGGQYANTLHSAGHNVVQSIAQQLNFPSFQSNRSLGNGQVSQATGPSGVPWTLWKSTSYMNESGRGVSAAWKTWSNQASSIGGKLVVVHDELEKPMGSVSIKTDPNASAKGHNGLKSIKAAIGNTPFVRLGIGIGRPVSRDSSEVASYVLRKMTSNEKEIINRKVDEVITKLSQVE
ncbi:hypothetical protein MRB53_040812 [Persea americana]|nr:hypothetical protein MRB53_040812 [Persea americana]